MAYFNRGGNGGGGFRDNRNSGRPSFGGGQDRDRSQMFSATCDECGRSCEVPFRPNGSKPIYCSSCFEARGNGGRPSRSGGFNDRPSEDRTSVRRFEPNGRPIDNQFEKEAKQQARFMEEIAKVNSKLDTLIGLLSPKTAEVAEETPKKLKKSKKVEEVT